MPLHKLSKSLSKSWHNLREVVDGRLSSVTRVSNTAMSSETIHRPASPTEGSSEGACYIPPDQLANVPLVAPPDGNDKPDLVRALQALIPAHQAPDSLPPYNHSTDTSKMNGREYIKYLSQGIPLDQYTDEDCEGSLFEYPIYGKLLYEQNKTNTIFRQKYKNFVMAVESGELEKINQKQEEKEEK